MARMQHIRNFSIIAHIDHGKSTLADRFIQMCGGLAEREMAEQVLDSMDLERERGITIKAQTAALDYKARDGETYQLNLIDTPGHVDFSYEVSRSLAACEGALLVVDASQGVEAQTVANCYTAIEQGVEVVPVLNKIDLPSADPAKAIQEIEDMIGIPAQDAIRASAKTGEGVDEILEAVIARIPPPQGDPDGPLKALIIDSWFDNYVGVVMLVRVVDGTLRPQGPDPADVHRRGLSVRAGRRVHAESESARGACRRRGRLRHRRASRSCSAAKVGDTVTLARQPAAEAAAGLQGDQAAGVRRPLSGRVERVRGAARALEKLHLNDASLHYEPETSQALGLRLPLRLPRPAAHGHRAGAPGARVRHGPDHHRADRGLRGPAARRHASQQIENPSKLPDPSKIEEIREPIMACTILVPQDYVGPVITLCTEKRGAQNNMQYSARQVMLTYEMPLNEVVMDFFDRLKSVSRGYASLDYEFKEYRAADMVRLDILINGDRVDALSQHGAPLGVAASRPRAGVRKMRS